MTEVVLDTPPNWQMYGRRGARPTMGKNATLSGRVCVIMAPSAGRPPGRPHFTKKETI